MFELHVLTANGLRGVTPFLDTDCTWSYREDGAPRRFAGIADAWHAAQSVAMDCGVRTAVFDRTAVIAIAWFDDRGDIVPPLARPA